MEFKKIKIESFKDADCSGTALDKVYAFINPSQYTSKIAMTYENTKTVGSPKSTYVFTNAGEEKLELGEIIVDGTGLVKLKKEVDGYVNTDVDGYIEKFRKVTCGYVGTSHRPPYLKITWGKLISKCVCNSFDVTYTLFNPDGTALRAKIKLGLLITADFDSKLKEAKLSSPDLTHWRTVKAGDTLPLMTYQVYGDSSYYEQIARINDLPHINAIEPGNELYFPPIKN